MRYSHVDFNGLAMPLSLYPEVPVTDEDIYVITSEGDRFDKLSMDFYDRVNFWWVIMVANANVIQSDSLAIPPGTQIRIPGNPEEYERQYNEELLSNRS